MANKAEVTMMKLELEGTTFIVPAEVTRRIEALEEECNMLRNKLRQTLDMRRAESEKMADIVLNNLNSGLQEADRVLKHSVADRTSPFALTVYKRILYGIEGKHANGEPLSELELARKSNLKKLVDKEGAK